MSLSFSGAGPDIFSFIIAKGWSGKTASARLDWLSAYHN